MKAIVYTKTGGLDVIKQEEIETPKPNDNQVLIEVKACSLNVSDGKLHTFIDKVYPQEETVNAINYLLTNHAQGKVVIKTEFK